MLYTGKLQTTDVTHIGNFGDIPSGLSVNYMILYKPWSGTGPTCTDRQLSLLASKP